MHNMKLLKKTKKEMIDLVYKINAMGRMELENFRKEVLCSLLDAKEKDFLRRAIDIREQELTPKYHIIENGEIKYSEFFND